MVRMSCSTARDMNSVPSQGTKILQDMQHGLLPKNVDPMLESYPASVLPTGPETRGSLLNLFNPEFSSSVQWRQSQHPSPGTERHCR